MMSQQVIPQLLEEKKSPKGIRTYVSLFSSAGVGCYGFKLEGFHCIATNELMESRLDVQKANKKCDYEEGYICGDIKDSLVQEKLSQQIKFWQDKYELKNVDVVFATPPCQGMSTANYKKTEDEQVRNSLVVEAIKLIEAIKPKIFIVENVRAFLNTTCTDVDGKDILIKDCINNHLDQDYHIFSKVINFMDYGVPSSRPRTLVIGTKKELHNISPLNLFPSRRHQITLKESIGKFRRLAFGEKDPNDILHFARPFPEYQLPWIENLKEGESAFKNVEPNRRPYKLDEFGNRIELKGSYMGNKYRRLFWDKPCACIATRNDQLASQDTIHPTDNRVLSIRELMSVMSIPYSFIWAEGQEKVSPENSSEFLRSNELNIRRCIGEAVPTVIIQTIAQKVNTMLDYESFVSSFDYNNPEKYVDYESNANFYIDTFIKEQNNAEAKESGSFYTPQCVVFDTVKSISIDKSYISILEPSIGLGAFLPQISSLFSEADCIEIDAVEINGDIVNTLQTCLNMIELGTNVVINYHCKDFMDFEFNKHYDLIVSNPPYGKTNTKYNNSEIIQYKTKNLFALFMLRFWGNAEQIACVIPKNFAIADEFIQVRHIFEFMPIVRICDFGVKYFKKVFVEIMSIHFATKYTGNTEVVDYINNADYLHPQSYMFHEKLWLLYRNSWFDEYIKQLRLDCFDFFRDRQITNQFLKDSGKYRVLKSKNILDNGSIVSIEGYDKFIDVIDPFAISKYINSGAIIMPNFTYNTRATILPNETIPNGSIAVLIPKQPLGKIDLGIYSTPEFREYYAIVKSRSKFTLNIDNCSVYYIGVKINELQ